MAEAFDCDVAYVYDERTHLLQDSTGEISLSVDETPDRDRGVHRPAALLPGGARMDGSAERPR